MTSVAHNGVETMRRARQRNAQSLQDLVSTDSRVQTHTRTLTNHSRRPVIAFQSGPWLKIPAWLARQRRALSERMYPSLTVDPNIQAAKDAREVDQEKAAT